MRGENPKIPEKAVFALYGRWGALVGRKILLRGVGTFSRPGKPIPGTFCFDPRNEARSLISILNSGAMSIPLFLTHPPTPELLFPHLGAGGR